MRQQQGPNVAIDAGRIVTITDAAARLGVGRVTLQRIVTGAAGVSPDMTYRLGAAFGTSPELWAGMQLQYDLYQGGKVKRPKIERIPAKRSS
jgi:antitoxin HigA-1